MFGGQDNTTTAPQVSTSSAPQDDLLTGVSSLVGGVTTTPTVTTSTDNGQNGTFLPTPTDLPQSGAPTLPDSTTTPTTSDSSKSQSDDDLLNIKQQALQQLTPLVNHLEQTPLEKFRTTMMLIQASDNQSLLKDAYEAAQKIEDEKIRAQALLDVVNEINYFTQSKEQ